MMKRQGKAIVKQFLVLFLGVVILLSGYGSIAHAENGFVDQIGAAPGEKVYVADEADLLSDSEESRLTENAKELEDKYQVSVVILTTEDMQAADIKDWIREVYGQMEENGQVESDGVVFAISMAERDWGLVGMGNAQEAFTTYGRERMGELIVPSLSDEDYYGGLVEFQSLSDKFLAEAQDGEPFSEDHPYKESVSILLIIAISFVLSLIVSLCIVLAWKKSMNTRIKRDGATEYMKQESFVLSRKTDRYLYRNVSRTRKESSKSSSGSMHSDSSGTSGKF